MSHLSRKEGVLMAHHEITIMRRGEGVIGVCACKHQQAQPVETKQLAEDWGHHHLEQAARSQADPGKKLSDVSYLEYLETQAANKDLPKRQREQWAQLAREWAPRVTGKKSAYDTGAETEPLF